MTAGKSSPSIHVPRSVRHATLAAAVALLGSGAWLSAQAPAASSSSPRASAAKPDANAIVAAVTMLGAADLQTLKYSGSGAIYAAGQGAGPAPAGLRVTLRRYEAAVDYPASAMQVDLAWDVGAPAPAGGSPVAASEQRQIHGVNGSTAWDIPFAPPPSAAGRVTLVPQAPLPNAAALAERRQGIWTTPHGFLKAALANQPALQPAGTGTEVSFFSGPRRYVGFINSRHQVERVRTWVAHPTLGDLLIDITYTGYERFGGIMFPTRISQRQGAHPALELAVDTVVPNAAVKIPVPEGLRESAVLPGDAQVPTLAHAVVR